MKSIKFIYFLFLLSLFTIRISAITTITDSQYSINRDTLIVQRQDPIYIQLYGGINKSANENLPYKEFSRYPFSFGAFIGLGKEITPLLGWRTSIGLNHNKSRNVMKCESSDTWGWNDIELFGDITFDITDVLKLKKSNSRFNLKAFTGIGGLWTYSFPQSIPLSYIYPYSRDSKLLFGFRAGLTTTWELTKCLKIGAELSHTMAQDRFNGVVDNKSPLDNRTNLSIGLTWVFKKNKQQPRSVVYSSRLRDLPYVPMFIPEKELNKKRQLQGSAFLDFPVNEIIIYPEYRNNSKELYKIKKSIDEVRFDNSVIINTISLHGYASPESPYSNNERLAKGRTAALVNYLKSEYKLNDIEFVMQYTPEDWGNLRQFIADSLNLENNDLYAYRKDILCVIDENINPDIKEDKLKKIGNGLPYQWLYENIYPALRHTDYLIEYTLKEYPVKDAKRLIYTNPEALSLEEMYNVAISYSENAEGYYDALIIAARQYSDNQIANYNAAAVCIKRRKLKDAKIFISKANGLDETSYLENIIKAMEGTINWHIVNNKLVVDYENK